MKRNVLLIAALMLFPILVLGKTVSQSNNQGKRNVSIGVTCYTRWRHPY